eukprot:m.422088 g.422088  ORF g.422088 m.422088 type:complete len:451 (+) comp36003_c0_seq1:240-1592(+)
MPSTAGDAGDAGGASAVAEEEQVLAGWLYKLAASRVKTYKWRWFVFDPYTGYLNFFKSKAPTATACGYIDMAACRSIETTDPELKRFVINLPSRQVTLMSSGPEETIYWMEELLERKSLLVQRAHDHSKDEDFPDWEMIPTTALDGLGAVMGVQDGPLSPVAVPDRGGDGDRRESGIPSATPVRNDDPDLKGMESGMGGHTMRGAQQRLDSGEITQEQYDHLKQVLTRPGADVASADAASADAYAAAHSPGAILGDLTRQIRSPRTPGALSPQRPRDGQSVDVADAVRAAVSAAEDAIRGQLAGQLSEAAEELGGRDEAIGLLEKEVVDMDRELTLKDKAIELLQRQLRAEQEARREETRYGITFADLQARLVRSQTELAHTKAVLDLQNHRIAAAMHQVTYYKSVVDGSGTNRKKEQALIFEQLVAQDQQLQVSEEMIQRLTKAASDTA